MNVISPKIKKLIWVLFSLYTGDLTGPFILSIGFIFSFLFFDFIVFYLIVDLLIIYFYSPLSLSLSEWEKHQTFSVMFCFLLYIKRKIFKFLWYKFHKSTIIYLCCHSKSITVTIPSKIGGGVMYFIHIYFLFIFLI